jgi:hypothetical protein
VWDAGCRFGGYYRTPASRRAFVRIVSLTAAKTRRMLLVSVACVKLHGLECWGCGGGVVLWINHHVVSLFHLRESVEDVFCCFSGIGTT